MSYLRDIGQDMSEKSSLTAMSGDNSMNEVIALAWAITFLPFKLTPLPRTTPAAFSSSLPGYFLPENVSVCEYILDNNVNHENHEIRENSDLGLSSPLKARFVTFSLGVESSTEENIPKPRPSLYAYTAELLGGGEPLQHAVEAHHAGFDANRPCAFMVPTACAGPSTPEAQAVLASYEKRHRLAQSEAKELFSSSLPHINAGSIPFFCHIFATMISSRVKVTHDDSKISPEASFSSSFLEALRREMENPATSCIARGYWARNEVDVTLESAKDSRLTQFGFDSTVTVEELDQHALDSEEKSRKKREREEAAKLRFKERTNQ